MSDKRYKLEDLKIGMQVTAEELENIYGVFIYLDAYDNNQLQGKILYMCEKPDEKTDQIRKQYGGLCCFYQGKEYLEEDFEVYE